MSTFIPYQVDHTVKNTAKTLGFSKKKIQFKFGFASPDACREGLTGAQCRGSEHEITFIWSLASGKRNLFVDGKEIHYSESGQNGWTQDRSWQHVFSLKEGNDRYRVHFITQPKVPEMPDVKPFDLRVNGVSFFQFSRIFELGTPRMQVRDVEPRGGRAYHGNGRDSPMSPEERRAVAAAKVESIRELREQQQIRQSGSHDSGSHQQAPLVREENLLNFDDPPSQAPAQQQQQMVPAYAVGGNTYGQQFTSTLTMDSTGDSQRMLSQASSFASPYDPSQQQQPPAYQGGYAGYGQPTLPTGYGQAPPPQVAYGYGQQQAPAPSNDYYGQQPPYGQPPVPSTQGFGQPPGSFSSQPDATGNVAALTPYQPAAGVPSPSPYALNPPPPLQNPYGGSPLYNSASSFQQNLQSPSAQSYASYGSAPSFAQPPSQQPPPPPSQANPYGAAPAAYYGQPPSPQTPYGGAPQQQQQQSYGQPSAFGF